MTNEKRRQIKEVMENHLKSRGWPHVHDPDRMVLEEVENMFRLLLRHNLVLYAEYDQFYMAAVGSYERAQLRRAGFNI